MTQIVLYALAIAFIGNAGYAPILIFLNERFPTAVRSSGTGLSWNIGFALGGMMPTFVSLASPTTADPRLVGRFLGRRVPDLPSGQRRHPGNEGSL